MSGIEGKVIAITGASSGIGEAAARELAPVAKIFGAATAGQALHAFAVAMKAPLALRDLGMQEADLDRASEIAVQNPYWNPRPIEQAAIRHLLQAAWAHVQHEAGHACWGLPECDPLEGWIVGV